MSQNLLFVSTNNIGTGLSGGDRIFLELARYWSSPDKIIILGSTETANLLKRYHLSLPLISIDSLDHSPIIFHQIRRVFKSFFYFFTHFKDFSNYDYIYSVSDFYPDSLTAFLIKIFNPRVKWIAGYYLQAPSPFSSQSPYNQNHRFFSGLIYFLGQIPIKFIIHHWANIVFITSNPDIKLFPHQKVIVIRGGVDVGPSQKKLPPLKSIYDAVFIGRLHPQKGVMELIDIWKLVTQKKPSAKLAIIGDGDLESDLKQKIKSLHLSQNISLLGFLDGSSKYRVFRQSKIVVHPATYDSGGMAAAEAMAWGLPGVSFDLEALKTYYPQGILKTSCFDQQKFADNILLLLTHPQTYHQYSQSAVKLITNSWSWPQQAATIYHQTFT